MRLHEMNEAFEKEGFDVKRDYVTDKKTYVFIIRKEGVSACDEYTWHVNLSSLENNLRQERFIKNLIHTWEKAYEKTHVKPNQLQIDLAKYGDKAKLMVNDNVYPIHITDVTIDSLIGEVPRISVEGDLRSFVPESRTCLYRPYTDGTEYIIAGRASGKSWLVAETYRRILNSIYGVGPFVIEKVIFNGPATIVMWMDGTKTIVKCQDGDEFDPEKGLAMAISKKAFGNKGNYCDVFKKCLKDCDIYYETINTDPNAGDSYNAHQVLLDILDNKKATKRDLIAAVKEAVGYLEHTHII